MNTTEYIALSEFCTSHGITSQFVVQWHEYGLIELVHRERMAYIPIQELPRAERIIRLHSDLEINLEGIEVVEQLLQRIEGLHEEITLLRNRLRRYE